MNLKEFIEYDFKNETIEKHIGDEARTFHITNTSKPLLSISRILKTFTEFKYWRIPSLNLLPNRLIGQLSHKIIEWFFKNGELTTLSNNQEQLKEILKKDFETFKTLSKEKKEKILNQVNKITKTTIELLKKLNIEILASEKYLCDLNYHGYIDLIGINEKNQVILIELKTSTQNIIKYETKLQMELYKKLFQEITNIEPLTYSIRFSTKENKVYWEKIETTKDFEKIDHIYKLILNE